MLKMVNWSTDKNVQKQIWMQNNMIKSFKTLQGYTYKSQYIIHNIDVQTFLSFYRLRFLSAPFCTVEVACRHISGLVRS